MAFSFADFLDIRSEFALHVDGNLANRNLYTINNLYSD